MLSNNIGLYSAFLLGIFHALEPGHGKTAIIGYLIGQKGSWLPAFALGLANAVTHGTLIFVVAVLFKSGMSTLEVNDSEEGLHVFSQFAGLFIIVMSLWLFYKESKEHDDCCDEKKVSLSELSKANTTWKQTRLSFLMGMSGGLVPCGSAVAMFLANISDGKFERGIYSVHINDVAHCPFDVMGEGCEKTGV